MLAGWRCAACGSNGGVLQVHHLTYARIFKENDDDLMVLCDEHHQKIEDLIAAGLLKRVGDVRVLAAETVRLLSPHQLAKREQKALSRVFRKRERRKRSEERHAAWVANGSQKKPAYIPSATFSGLVRPNNEKQEAMLSDPLFVEALILDRKQFKKQTCPALSQRAHHQDSCP